MHHFNSFLGDLPVAAVSVQPASEGRTVQRKYGGIS
jgi:hypothetical protein